MWVKYQQRAGFTIVELLIVIVIIGILAAITIVAYNGITQRAKVSSANHDLTELNKAILAGRVNTGKTLLAITGSNCTYCSDADGSKMAAALDKISVASGMNLASLKGGDPWGNAYKLDENEGEAGSCSTKDFLGQTVVQSGVNSINVPFFTCP